jgi:hypothetical protein
MGQGLIRRGRFTGLTERDHREEGEEEDEG